MQGGARAARLAVAALLLGLLGQLLLFDVGLGINYPILVTALLAAIWLAAAPAERGLRPADAWLPVAAIGFAIPLALRGDRTLAVLDILGSLALVAASVAAFGGLRIVDRSVGDLLVLGGRVAGAAAGWAAGVTGPLLRNLPSGSLRTGLGRWGGVLRGAAIALPMVLIFVALFSAADAVFAEWVGRLTAWDLDLGGAIGRTLMALVIAWLAAGLLAFAAQPGESQAEGELLGAWSRRPRIGEVEVVTVLVALDAVFGAFVVLQAAYLFGGLDTLAESGLTYAEYARRGFFELLAVAFLVGGLVLGAESFVRDRTRLYRATLIGLVALTLVVLASAFLRLRMYQDAYGWTELRFYVMAAIFWFGLGAALAVGTVLAGRSGWLLHGMLALSIVFGIAFNVIGPVRFVAEQNVARMTDDAVTASGGKINFDLQYLISLGPDALPAVSAWLADHTIPPVLGEGIHERLVAASGLDDPGNDAWQAWNFSREHARERLGR